MSCTAVITAVPSSSRTTPNAPVVSPISAARPLIVSPTPFPKSS